MLGRTFDFVYRDFVYRDFVYRDFVYRDFVYLDSAVHGHLAITIPSQLDFVVDFPLWYSCSIILYPANRTPSYI
jgi:hypothetical protein